MRNIRTPHLIFLSYFLFSLLQPGKAENILSYSFRGLTIKNGLSHTDANTIVQDKKGFIWIGTYSGLDRYDGYQIQSFYNELNFINKSYLNRIADIAIDKDGMLWLATFSGIQLFNPFTEKFLPVEISNEGSQKGEHEIKKVAILNENYLFTIDKEQKIAMYRIHNNRSLTREPFSLNADCYALFTDSKDQIWISTNKGVWRVNEDNELSHYSFPELSDRILFTYINSHNDLFVSNENEFYIYQLPVQLSNNDRSYKIENGVPVFLSRDYGQITDICQFGEEEYWIATLKGLYNLRKKENMYSATAMYAHDFFDGLNSDYINKLLIDRSENLMVATYGGGVNILDLNQKSFHLLQRLPYTSQTLSEKIVRALFEDENYLWIGTNTRGLTRINLTTHMYDFYDSGMQNCIASNEIRAINKDKENNLWIGHSKGIDIILPNREKNILFMSEKEKPEFPVVEVSSIAIDYFNQIWVGTWSQGICRIRKDETGRYETEFFNQTRPDYPAFSPNRIITVYTPPGRPEVFFSSGEQLVRILLDSFGNVDKTLIYSANNQREHSLSSNFICSIECKNDSVLWIGSIGGGLSEMHLLAEGDYRAINFTEKEGLTLKDIECIEKDSEGNIWLAGNELVKYEVKKNMFKTYTIDNSTSYNNSYKVGASCRGRNGKIYFGGINGSVYFDPSQIKESTIAAQPEITSLLINNQYLPIEPSKKKGGSTLQQSITYTDKIHLRYNENNLTLHFTALNYVNPSGCEFRYRLKSYDKEWKFTNGIIPLASYTNLPPGKYEFELYASNNDGIWNSQKRLLIIDISPPWWLSITAKIAYILFFLVVLYIIFLYLLRWIDLKKQLEIKDLKEKQKEQVHQLQLQFFTTISHEFRTPLTLISGIVEQMSQDSFRKKNQHQFETLMSNVNRLMRLINELMDFRKAETGSFHLMVQENDINHFIYILADEFHSLAQKKEILFDIQVEKSVRRVWFDPIITEKIIINLLNNAFKYTQTGGYIQIKVFFDKKNHISPFDNYHTIDSGTEAKSHFYLSIKDNGPGISKASIEKVFDRYYQIEDSEYDPHLGSGIGLALVKSLILLHKGRLTIFSERNKGTEFIAEIPCTKEDYLPAEIGADNAYSLPGVENMNIIEYTPVKNIPQEKENSEKNLKPSILLVEDNDEVRDFLTELLSPYYNIQTAINGVYALEMMKCFTPDLIISDLMMPAMDGITFCQRIKSDPETSPIPFIILTAKNNLDDKIISIDSGADAYLNKPVSIQLLQATIHNLLTQQQRIKSHLSSNYLSKAIDETLQTKDRAFYEQFILIIEEHIADIELDVDLISKKMGCSRTKLYQRVRDITNKPIMDMVRSIRLRKATQYMAEEDISIQEIMQKVGIQSQSYFTSSFKKEYGKTPSQFIKELKNK